MLKVLLLGTPQIFWDEQPVSIRRRYPRALLYYLAAQNDKVSRNELLPIFWEEESEPVARKRLRETLNKLRSELPDPSVLVVYKDLISLDFDRTQVDLQQFQELLHQIGRVSNRVPENEPLPEPVYQMLQKAISLWHGTRFMAGAGLPNCRALDHWLTVTAQQNEHQYISLLERLAQHEKITGGLEQSLLFMRRILAMDDTNEDLHESVMQLLIDLGKRGEAMDHYKYIEKVARREGMAPSSRLVKLYQAARLGSPGLPSPSIKRLLVHPSLQAPLIGRQEVLGQLRKAYTRGGLVFLLGESGIGKTRLVQEFINRLDPLPRLLTARCSPSGQELPFQPFLDGGLRDLTQKEWQALPAIWASQITTIYPELRALRPELPEPNGPPGFVHLLLFEALWQLTIRITGGGRLLAFLDDAQWADESSLGAIAYMHDREPFNGNSLQIIAARLEEHNPHLEKIFNDLSHSSRTTVIYLNRLSQVDTRDLVEVILGATPSPEFIKQFAHDTGGNPLFILESLRALLAEQPHPDISQPVKIPLADTLQTLIHGRLRELTPLSRTVIEMAAVSGSQFGPTFLAEATGLSLAEIAQAIGELQKAGLIQLYNPDIPDEQHYQFVHDKFREVIINGLNPVQARLFHAGIARALETIMGPAKKQHAATLAQHFMQAGDYPAAFKYWVEAGQHTYNLHSLSDTVSHFQKSESLIPLCGDRLTESEIYRLYHIWNEMEFRRGNGEAMNAISARLLDIGRQRHSELLLGAAFLGLADASQTLYHFEESISYTEQALPFITRSGNPYETIHAYICRGSAFFFLNRKPAALDAFQTALSVGKDLTQIEVVKARAMVLYHLAMIYNLSGWPRRARFYGLRAYKDFENIQFSFGQVMAQNALGASDQLMGKYQLAQTEVEVGITIAKNMQTNLGEGYGLVVLAFIELAGGKLADAFDHAQKALELGGKAEHRETRVLSLLILGTIYLTLKSYQLALEYYQKGVELTRGSLWGLDFQMRIGYLQHLIGQESQGAITLKKAVLLAEKNDLGLARLMGRISQAKICLIQSEWEEARKIAIQVRKEANRRLLHSIKIEAIFIMGVAAFSEADYLTAANYFHDAMTRASLLPDVWMTLKSLAYLEKTQTYLNDAKTVYREEMDKILEQVKANFRPDSDKQLTEAYVAYRNSDLSTF